LHVALQLEVVTRGENGQNPHELIHGYLIDLTAVDKYVYDKHARVLMRVTAYTSLRVSNRGLLIF